MNLELVFKHSLFQASNTLRHPEQVLLLIGTPLAVMFFFSGTSQIFSYTLATCVLSTAFTSNAITTAFGRRYGSLKYFSTTPLGLYGVVFGQAVAGIILILIQLPVAFLVARLLSIETNLSLGILLGLVIQTVLFTQWSYIFASQLSAEKVLALANVVFLGLLLTGALKIDDNAIYLHPVAGITSTGDNFVFFLGTVLLLNCLSFIILKKVFKWID